MQLLVLLSLLMSAAAQVPKLLKEVQGLQLLRQIAACSAPKISSCVRIDIDFSVVGNERLEFPEGTVMEIHHVIRSNSSTVYAYEAEDGSEAVVTAMTKRGNGGAAAQQTITATINLVQPRKSFSVESCNDGRGRECHVLIEGSDEMRQADVEVVVPEANDRIVRNDYESGPTPEDRQSGRTVLSVNFFYTDEFEWVTADPEGYVNTLVAYANVGYVNSELDMELEIFCIQRLPFFSETDNGAAMLEDFRMSFGTEEQTMNTADVAILLVSQPRGGGCGQAYANGYQHGSNFGWVAKNCHLTLLAHEIGHMFGVAHDIGAIHSFTPNEGWEYGFEMPYNAANWVVGGWVTILGYTSDAWPHRLNYLASPNITFRGTPTGRDDRDSRRAHIERKAVMSARGNETGTCEWHGPACFNTLSDAFCQSNTWYCCRFQPCQGLCQRACDRCLWW